jgi:hypothetical protein
MSRRSGAIDTRYLKAFTDSGDAFRGALRAEHREALQAHRTALLVHLARREQWAELSSWRWGPAVGDPTPGIIIPHPTEIQ